MVFGEYPAEYDKAKHGPFDPARYYGKPDTPFGQVKLGELGAWFGRRNKTPQAAMELCTRAIWRWQHKYVLTVRGGMAGFFQTSMALMFVGVLFCQPRSRLHRRYHYH